MKEIIKLYLNEYVGKEFVYEGKYGRTFGIVGNILTTTEMIMDEESDTMIRFKLDHLSPKGSKSMLKPKTTNCRKYVATRHKMYIVSTIGNRYELENCYIIDK